jgi:hypothetical protein
MSGGYAACTGCVGALLGSVLPFNGKTMLDAMFTEGGLGGKPGKAGACSCPAPRLHGCMLQLQLHLLQ